MSAKYQQYRTLLSLFDEIVDMRIGRDWIMLYIKSKLESLMTDMLNWNSKDDSSMNFTFQNSALRNSHQVRNEATSNDHAELNQITWLGNPHVSISRRRPRSNCIRSIIEPRGRGRSRVRGRGREVITNGQLLNIFGDGA